MKRRLAFLCCAALLGVSAALWAGADPDRYLGYLRHLASPEMKGRGAGTPELDKAARYLAAEFQAAGLEPLNGRSYLQSFQMTVGATLGPRNVFEIFSGGQKKALLSGQDFLPFSFSSRSAVTAAVVFAGYGITAPEYHYDDYAHLDVKGKIVLVLRHEPQEFDEKSVFRGKDFTQHAAFINKAINARNRGARALLIVNDRAAHPTEDDALAKFGTTSGPRDSGLPVVQVKAVVADQWLAGAGKSLRELQAAIDKTLEPQPVALPDSLQLNIQTDIEHKVATASNVAGFLPGKSQEHVVIGAHYDHLGLGEQYSLLESAVGRIHPGADDNASGAAALIELARMFATRRGSLSRGIVFLAFAGEEIGLLGSAHYTDHPLLPLDKAVTMINLDMIGRVRNAKLYIGGVATGSTFQPLVDEALKKVSFQVDFSGPDHGGSDHTSFASKRVPALFFFSGLHGDYHKPSDTADKIDAAGAARVLDLVFDVAERLAQAPDRPQFLRAVGGPGPAATGSAGGGYGPSFGSIPDFGHSENGVKFADVREGSPASKAGLKAGDVLVEFDGKPIKNLYDFTYALRTKKAGDQVEVQVIRQGSAVRATVTLEQRR